MALIAFSAYQSGHGTHPIIIVVIRPQLKQSAATCC
jgi:hypothetical protein